MDSFDFLFFHYDVTVNNNKCSFWIDWLISGVFQVQIEMMVHTALLNSNFISRKTIKIITRIYSDVSDSEREEWNRLLILCGCSINSSITFTHWRSYWNWNLINLIIWLHSYNVQSIFSANYIQSESAGMSLRWYWISSRSDMKSAELFGRRLSVKIQFLLFLQRFWYRMLAPGSSTDIKYLCFIFPH